MTEEPARRRRDAAQTRQRLLDVARLRFIRDGYAATTVRDIADDAGVNVALINRYFTSKEGLFEACLGLAVSDVRADGLDDLTLEQIAARMIGRIVGATDDRRMQEALLLMLRTSGDERIDEMRRTVLETVSRKLAAAAGGGDDPGRDAILRAQLVLGTAVGMSILRASLRLEPLASADEQELIGPLTDVITAALARH